MKERPILFSAPMVRAILDGRKTQTRRVVKFSKNPNDAHLQHEVLKSDFINFNLGSDFMPCPYGMPGDRLWVRETFQWVDLGLEDSGWVYRATDPDWETTEEWTWKPSVFMPRAASRIDLEITKVRVERLRQISDTDAIKEGIELWVEERMASKPTHYKVYHIPKEMKKDPPFYTSSAIDSYSTLWESINGPESWAQNPWVWVVEFKAIESKTIDP